MLPKQEVKNRNARMLWFNFCVDQSNISAVHFVINRQIILENVKSGTLTTQTYPKYTP